MDLWQMDVMGRVSLVGGADVKIVTGHAGHSATGVPGAAPARDIGADPDR
jgi:hypothetical protein